MAQIGDPSREKSLGIAACTAIVVGNMVGSGFYLSPPAVAPLRHPGDRRLGPHGSRRNLPRAHLCQARKTAAGNRRALCLYPHCLWRFPGISDCLGLLDLDLGITAGYRGRLCRRHHRHVPRPAQPDHGDGADAGGALGCGAHQSARRQGGRPLRRADDLFEIDTVRGDRDYWAVLHRSDAISASSTPAASRCSLRQQLSHR